jgi:hypothetical protein
VRQGRPRPDRDDGLEAHSLGAKLPGLILQLIGNLKFGHLGRQLGPHHLKAATGQIACAPGALNLVLVLDDA